MTVRANRIIIESTPSCWLRASPLFLAHRSSHGLTPLTKSSGSTSPPAECRGRCFSSAPPCCGRPFDFLRPDVARDCSSILHLLVVLATFILVLIAALARQGCVGDDAERADLVLHRAPVGNLSGPAWVRHSQRSGATRHFAHLLRHLAALLVACGSDQDVTQYGSNPELPEPNRGLLPSMTIADPAGWDIAGRWSRQATGSLRLRSSTGRSAPDLGAAQRLYSRGRGQGRWRCTRDAAEGQDRRLFQEAGHQSGEGRRPLDLASRCQW